MGKSEELANRLTYELNKLITTQIENLKSKFEQFQEEEEASSMQVDEGTAASDDSALVFLKNFWLQFCF